MQKNVWNAYVRPQGAKTVGSMDLGGASTQIAFAVQDDLKGADYLRVKLYGYPYNVYTHSFLCYGKNEAGKLVLEKVVQVNDFVLRFFYKYAQKKNSVFHWTLIFPRYYKSGGSFLRLLCVAVLSFKCSGNVWLFAHMCTAKSINGQFVEWLVNAAVPELLTAKGSRDALCH